MVIFTLANCVRAANTKTFLAQFLNFEAILPNISKDLHTTRPPPFPRGVNLESSWLGSQQIFHSPIQNETTDHEIPRLVPGGNYKKKVSGVSENHRYTKLWAVNFPPLPKHLSYAPGNKNDFLWLTSLDEKKPGV